jgi:tartrate dehydratase beta subunit/fumarate hydratase class I family protein
MPEAMWVPKIEQFDPIIVMMNTQGRSRYDELREGTEKSIASTQN